MACDLDRTLIYSANSMALTGSDQLAPRMVVAEVYDAAPLSFMTRAAEELLAGIVERSIFVPVTTRTQAQFARVRLPGRAAGTPSPPTARCCCTTASLIRGWSRHIRRSLRAACVPLGEVLERLTGGAAFPGILRVRAAEDSFVYSIVDRHELSGRRP